MYVEIKLDCQTKTDNPSCEYCIAHQECQLQKSLNLKDEENLKEQLKANLLAPLCQSK